MGIFEAFLALCFLIFFHELGHFCAARAFGVRVEVFSIGFGYKIFKKTIGDTQYAISLIPLGGYVKLKGQSDINPLESDNAPDSYTSKSPLAKIIILLAGVAFNFLLAFLLYFVVGLAGAKTLLPVIGEVAPNSPAQKAGVLAGDVVLAVDNAPIKTWDKLSQIIADSAPQTTAPKSKASDNDIAGARESGMPEFKAIDSALLDSATQAPKTITLTIKRANSANHASTTNPDSANSTSHAESKIAESSLAE
ncbi:RIP metalloprotease RseP, partial [Helicobacter sp. 'CLO3_human']